MSDIATSVPKAEAPPVEASLLARILEQPKGRIGLAIVGLCAVLALFGPWLAPKDPYLQNFAMTLRPPSLQHWFGTDQLGRDVFSRVLTGARTSLGIGVGGVALAFLIGVPLGVLAGFRGGRFDFLLMRAIDVMLSFPDIILALAIVAIFGASTGNVILAVGLVSVPIFARTARAVTMSTAAEPYIEGSISLGCSPTRVVWRHILPNIAGTLLTLASLLFATTLLTASGLGFLGLGTQPPEPEWGTMLGEGRSYIRTHTYIATFPGLFLALAALGFNLLGEALRAIYDPTARVTGRRAAPPPVAAKTQPRDTAPAEPPALRVDDLRVTYFANRSALEAVKAVTLDLPRGRTLAIVGESGSGKSTLLRSVATLLPAGRAAVTGGEIEIAGHPISALDRGAIRELRRKDIGVVFQDAASALNPVLSVGAQLSEAIRVGRELSAAEVRAEAIRLLEDVRISDPASRLDMYPHQFSGGMKQRIVIAMALAQNPGLLLADEPTSALDVTIQQQILTLLRELQRERGMAMLLVTHDLGLVARYADDVAVMYGGRLVETGAVADVFTHPRHPYTLGLKRSVPSMGGRRGDGLSAIPGDPPNLARMPEGCVFAPRCFLAEGRPLCAGEQPALRPVGASRTACHYAEELP